MSQLDLDPQFTQGLRLLHSTNKDSADQLRTLLDDAIKQKHGPIKMLCNVLHKKYMVEEPVLSDHSSGSSKKSRSSSSKHSNKSSKNSSPVNLPSRDTPPDILQADDTLALEILEADLMCVICKGMDVGARNRLVECAECHSLYHQECHLPHILDSQIDVPRGLWYCSNCIKTTQVPKERNSPKIVTEGKSKDQRKSGLKGADKYKSSQSQVSNGGATSASSLKAASGSSAAEKRSKETMKKPKMEKRSANSGTSKHSTSCSSKSSHEKLLLYKAKSGSE